MNKPSNGVSLRRRKHLFGEQVELNQAENQDQNPVTPIVPEQSAITAQEEQPKRKRGRPRLLNPKTRPKSTEYVREWFIRKKEAAKKGDENAIEFFTNRNRDKAKKAREKTARIQKGTASLKEQEQYKHLRSKQKQWRDQHRPERNAYLKKWRAQQNLKSEKKDE